MTVSGSDSIPLKTQSVLILAQTVVGPGAVGFEGVRRLLKHSWSPINYIYELLTPQEQSAISKQDFELLVPWVKDA